MPIDVAYTRVKGSPRVAWTCLLIGSVLSLYVSYRVATQSIILGSREGHWIYPYISAFGVRSLAVFLVVSGLGAWLVIAQDGIARRRPWLVVGAWIVGAVLLQGLLRSLTPYSFEHIFTSDSANAFYGVTRRYTAETVLTEYEQARAMWPLHAQSNMPGKLMLVYALKYISRRTDILPWLVVALSNVGGLLMYWFVKDLFGDERTALYSMVLYMFVPAKLFFFPLMNVITPVIVLACAVLVLRWVLTGKTVYAAALGAALYALVFFEPLPLVMGLLFAALVARSWWRADISTKRLLLQGAGVIGVFLACYVVVSVQVRFDLLSTFRQIAAHATAFNIEAQRPYGVWIRENLYEFVLGMGICQAVLFWAALSEGLHGAGSRASRILHPATTLCLALLAILMVTDLIGVNRGEVIRLWIFLACFFQIPTAYVCARLEHHRAALLLVVGATVLQVAVGTSMIGFIIP